MATTITVAAPRFDNMPIYPITMHKYCFHTLWQQRNLAEPLPRTPPKINRIMRFRATKRIRLPCQIKHRHRIIKPYFMKKPTLWALINHLDRRQQRPHLRRHQQFLTHFTHNRLCTQFAEVDSPTRQ